MSWRGSAEAGGAATRAPLASRDESDGREAGSGVVRDEWSRRLLGGSSSPCADSESVPVSRPHTSGFWLYAKPMRVIPAMLVSADRKIRVRKKGRNDFFRAAHTLWYTMRAASRRSAAL